MTCDPNALADALHAGFAMGVLVGGCAVAAIGFLGLGVWAAVQHRRNPEPHPVALPPLGHPEHPGVYSDGWARRRFEDMRIVLDARRSAWGRRG